MKDKIFYSIEEIIKIVLNDYSIDGVLKTQGNTDHLYYASVIDDDLIFLISFDTQKLNHIISVDNKKCFNKTSQCPIHFDLNISRRKNNRLHQALTFLRTKEGERASATFEWYGWDEFNWQNRDKFYK